MIVLKRTTHNLKSDCVIYGHGDKRLEFLIENSFVGHQNIYTNGMLYGNLQSFLCKKKNILSLNCNRY